MTDRDDIEGLADLRTKDLLNAILLAGSGYAGWKLYERLKETWEYNSLPQEHKKIVHGPTEEQITRFVNMASEMRMQWLETKWRSDGSMYTTYKNTLAKLGWKADLILYWKLYDKVKTRLTKSQMDAHIAFVLFIQKEKL